MIGLCSGAKLHNIFSIYFIISFKKLLKNIIIDKKRGKFLCFCLLLFVSLPAKQKYYERKERLDE